MEFTALPSHLCFSVHSLYHGTPSRSSLFLNLFSGKIVFSLGGRFGAEKNRFLVVHSTLHSTTCPELIKCILNDLLEHQEEKVLDRFCSSVSGISSRDS